MRYLITGGRGMLGSSFATALGDQGVAVGKEAFDAADPASVRLLLAQVCPDVVINCAANVDAEAAEVDPRPAELANVVLPRILSEVCCERRLTLVHFSSTGCYGDWKRDGSAYTELDALRPTTVHHETKRLGEEAVRTAGSHHLILRTGWLFGGGPEHRRNFVWKRLVEAAGSTSIQSDAYQRGNPTYSADVVNQTVLLLKHGVNGTYNCVGAGAASRLDYVAEIIKHSGIKCDVIASGPFNRLAPVSLNETAANDGLAARRLDVMPAWREGLRRYMTEVLSFPEWATLKARLGANLRA